MVRRRRHGRDINGILVLNKSKNVSSNSALQSAKKLFFAAKAGHTGSLDPLATGVLPICFGEATKFSQFLLDSDKRYVSTFKLGIKTATGDSEGEVLCNQCVTGLEKSQVLEVISSFIGVIAQIPSMYSALKHQGKPLYKLAREGIEVERKARKVTVYSIDLLDFRNGKNPEIDLDVRCSKGTYIRSLAEDLGEKLGCGAHVSALHRSQSGPFGDEDAITIDALEQMRGCNRAEVLDHLILPIDAAVAHLPVVIVPNNLAQYIRQGQAVRVPDESPKELVRLCLESGEFIGLGAVLADGRIIPRRLIVQS